MRRLLLGLAVVVVPVQAQACDTVLLSCTINGSHIKSEFLKALHRALMPTLRVKQFAHSSEEHAA